MDCVSEPRECYGNGKEKGYIWLWRKIMDSSFYKNANKTHFFLYCVMKATHKDVKILLDGSEIEIKRGQFVFGRKKASEETGLSEQEIRTCLRFHTEKSKNLTINSTKRYSIITICSYEDYQNPNMQSNQDFNQVSTKYQPSSNQVATTYNNNKNYKNNKNKKKEEASFSVLAYLESLNDGINYNLPNINDYDYTELLVSDYDQEKTRDYEIAQIWIVYRQLFPLGMKFKSCYQHLQLLFEDNNMTVQKARADLHKIQKATGKKGLKIWEALPIKPMTDAEKWKAGEAERDKRFDIVFEQMRKEREERGEE